MLKSVTVVSGHLWTSSRDFSPNVPIATQVRGGVGEREDLQRQSPGLTVYMKGFHPSNHANLSPQTQN